VAATTQRNKTGRRLVMYITFRYRVYYSINDDNIEKIIIFSNTVRT